MGLEPLGLDPGNQTFVHGQLVLPVGKTQLRGQDVQQIVFADEMVFNQDLAQLLAFAVPLDAQSRFHILVADQPELVNQGSDPDVQSVFVQGFLDIFFGNQFQFAQNHEQRLFLAQLFTNPQSVFQVLFGN